ncbi:MAG: hypothetical protein IKK08_12370 [Clostridia bacterium]|nr:hypothetical protein [Clostridia bacterium]
MSDQKHGRVREVIGRILFVSLVLSIIFSAVRFTQAPKVIAAGMEHAKVKSDYLLMLLQCVLGLVVMLLPTLIEHRWHLGIANAIHILYYIFLYCAVFLGEVFEFYYLVPHWDTILHFFSGAMLSALGFILVDLLNRNERVRVNLSPLFVAVFAFCFALAAGAVWEIYEFTGDSLFGLNMQKCLTEHGEALVGYAALRDTMKDIVVDAAAAMLISVLGYFSIVKQRKRPDPDLAKQKTE